MKQNDHYKISPDQKLHQDNCDRKNEIIEIEVSLSSSANNDQNKLEFQSSPSIPKENSKTLVEVEDTNSLHLPSKNIFFFSSKNRE